MQAIIERVRFGWWIARGHAGAGLLCLFFIIVSKLFRISIGIHPSLAGTLDDISVAFFVFALFIFSSYFSYGIRLLLLCIAGGSFSFLCFVGALYYRFFRSLIPFNATKMIEHAGDAATSIADLIKETDLLYFILLPIVFLTVAGAFLRCRPNIGTPKLLVFTLLICVGSKIGWGLSLHEGFVSNDHNPIGYFAFSFVEGINEEFFLDRESVLEKISSESQELYNGDKSGRYRFLKDPFWPLYKSPKYSDQKTQKKNVVLVVMESLRAFELYDWQNEFAFAPNLRSLAKESIYFPNFYFNGNQTRKGELALLCSVLPGSGSGWVFTMYPTLSVYCLPEILADHGWSTFWINMYTSTYGNAFDFLSRHGIQKFFDRDTIGNRPLIKPKVGWGASDEDLFEYSIEILSHAQEPFFAEILTLSSHHPFKHNFGIDFPKEVLKDHGSKNYNDYVRAIYYVDYAIGQFVEEVQDEPWFENTIFAFVGDHGVYFFPENDPENNLSSLEKTDAYFRSGLLLWAPKLIKPDINMTLGSQIDFAPTILDLVGIEVHNGFMGASLFESIPQEDRFAIMLSENAWNYREDDRYCYALGQDCFKTVSPVCPPGREPSFAGHLCVEVVRQERGLFGDYTVKELSPETRGRMLDRGNRLQKYNKWLLRYDALFPRNLR